MTTRDRPIIPRLIQLNEKINRGNIEVAKLVSMMGTSSLADYENLEQPEGLSYGFMMANIISFYEGKKAKRIATDKKRAKKAADAKNKSNREKKKAMLAHWTSGKWKTKAACARANYQALRIKYYDTAYTYLKVPKPKRK
jgi:hypothetical protein